MHDHDLWFLVLNWERWFFLGMMVLAIIVLFVTRNSYTTVNRRGDEVKRVSASSFGILAITAVLYLGIYWESWRWYGWLIVIAWCVGLIAAIVYQFSGSFRPLAHGASRLAFLLVILMLVISFFGWLFSGNVHPAWSWLVWAVVVALVVLLVIGLRRGKSGVALAALLVLLLVGGVWAVNNMFGGNSDNNVATPPASSSTSVPSQTPTGSSTTTPGPSATAACPTTWEIKYLNHSGNRVVYEGIMSIQNAKTPAQAKAAAFDVLHKVQTDPINLSGYIAYFLHKDVSPDALMTADKKCASDAAGSYVAQLELVVANADVTPGEAPENGTNSGVDNGTVVSSTTVGITGNRKAIKIVFKDEKGVTHVVWVLARCGNPVTTGKAPVPHGKTEHQPPKKTHTNTPVCDKKPRLGSILLSNCSYLKLDQSDGCKLNASGCHVPNVFVDKPQSKPVGTTTGAPATQPPAKPSQTTAPGGSSGTSTGTASGTPSCVAAEGCGNPSHTDPPPTTSIP